MTEERTETDSDFFSVLNRLSSLSDFSRGIDISLIRLAYAGFYKVRHGEGSLTRCFSCGAAYDKWKSGDDPMKIHKMLNSACKVVTAVGASLFRPSLCNSVALTEDALRSEDNLRTPQEGKCTLQNQASCSEPSPQSIEAHVLGRSFVDCIFRENTETRENVTDCTPLPSLVRAATNKDIKFLDLETEKKIGNNQMADRYDSVERNDIGCLTENQNQTKPKYPDYASMRARIGSYAGWPAYLDQTAEQMSEAGFLYSGYNDYTRCFSCGGGLRNWEAGDDPWVEHARWFPKCSYIRQTKGDRYIAVVQKKHQELMTKQNYDVPVQVPTTSESRSKACTFDGKSPESKIQHEENRQLKEKGLCKVCLDFDATIAFLPCGHIVCCVDCAPAMRKCPVCRTHVKGTVKTYLA